MTNDQPRQTDLQRAGLFLGGYWRDHGDLCFDYEGTRYHVRTPDLQDLGKRLRKGEPNPVKAWLAEVNVRRSYPAPRR